MSTSTATPSTTAAIREVFISNPGVAFSVFVIESRQFNISGRSMTDSAVASRIRTLRAGGLNVVTVRNGRDISYKFVA